MTLSALGPDQMALLIEVVQELSYPLELEDVMKRVRTAARELLAADGITFVLREGDRVYYADEHAIAPLWKGQSFPISQCISGWAILHRESVVIENIYEDDRIPHDAYRPTFVNSLAMVPIRRSAPVGAIGAYWADRHRATPSELAILETLANAAAGAFVSAELRRQLIDASRAKDAFLAMLGHELRNPLAPMLTALHLLQQRGAAAEREHAVIERQMKHLMRLVDDLLDVARLTRGSLVLKREEVDLSDIVKKAIESASPLLEQRRHQLEVDVEHGLLLSADATRLAQVLANVLTNAAKYTPAEGYIRLSATRRDGEVVIRVKDTGTGIAPELLPQVFDLFVQGSQSIDRSQGGLGIGLAIARGIVVQHGGTIAATSEGSGTGAEVTITLPMLAGRAADAAVKTAGTDAAVPRSMKGIARHRVLVVDDNQDAAEMLSIALDDAGYETRCAHDALQALAIAPTFVPEVALLDIGLPVMDGYELAVRLRETLPDPVGLVAVTGYGQEADRQRSRDAGIDLHFVKPVDMRALLKAIRDLLEPRARAQA